MLLVYCLVAVSDLCVVLYIMKERFVGLEMENGVHESPGLVVLISTKGHLQLFLRQLFRRLSFLYGLAQVFLFQLERFNGAGHRVMCHLFVQALNLLGLVVVCELEVVDLLLLLLDYGF